jgi:predicted GIY-YIG superfamily endonuclease
MKSLAIGPHALMPSQLPRCGGCYLIHFDQPYTSSNGKATIQHYLGWTTNLRRRIAHHQEGNGVRLMEVINAAGISWRVVHLWLEATRRDERRLKLQKKNWRLCPVCHPTLRRGAVMRTAQPSVLPFPSL